MVARKQRLRRESLECAALLRDRHALLTGVEGVMLSPQLAAALNSPEGGLLLQRIAQDSPAAAIGLRGGDIPALLGGERLLLGGDMILILAGVRIDGTTDSLERVRAALDSADPGTTIEMTVLRKGRLHYLGIVVR